MSSSSSVCNSPTVGSKAMNEAAYDPLQGRDSARYLIGNSTLSARLIGIQKILCRMTVSHESDNRSSWSISPRCDLHVMSVSTRFRKLAIWPRAGLSSLWTQENPETRRDIKFLMWDRRSKTSLECRIREVWYSYAVIMTGSGLEVPARVKERMK